MSEKQKMILFNNISVGLPAISYIAIIFAPNSNFAIFGFFSASIFYSAACGGFYKCATLTSRQFGHLIMAGIQLNKCLAFFISPALINIFVKQIKNKKEWNNIFILFFILTFLANILFCIMATDKPQEFTQTNEERNKINNCNNRKCYFCIGN
uniref:MFS domain-containing protein n=1 Tax=Meloidogyne hapla TaxID=6305 RepID=A0A1I8AYP6_MELHA